MFVPGFMQRVEFVFSPNCLFCFFFFWIEDFYTTEPKTDYFSISLSADCRSDSSSNCIRCLRWGVTWNTSSERKAGRKSTGERIFVLFYVVVVCWKGQTLELQYGNEGYPETRHSWANHQWVWLRIAAVDLAH